jgi:hypothetical protein
VGLARERTLPTEQRSLSAKLVPNFADRGCHVVRATDSYGRIIGFLDQTRYYFFQVAPQFYSRGWVDPVPLLRKSSSAGKRSRDLWICSQELWSLDHRSGHSCSCIKKIIIKKCLSAGPVSSATLWRRKKSKSSGFRSKRVLMLGGGGREQSDFLLLFWGSPAAFIAEV